MPRFSLRMLLLAMCTACALAAWYGSERGVSIKIERRNTPSGQDFRSGENNFSTWPK